MLIRKFKDEDLKEIPSLIRRAIIERDNRNYNSEQIELSASYYTAEKFCENIENKAIYVCVDNGSIVGTATLNHDEIMACFILPEYQGKGIGREFIRVLEKEARLKGLSRVWCVSVLSAVEFYKKLGYSFVSEKMHKDWGKGIVFEKKLV